MKEAVSPVVFVAVLASIVTAAALFGPSTPPVPPPPPPAFFGVFRPSPAQAERLFKLQAVYRRIDSAYWYESNLLDYSPPAQDSDFMLPVGAQEVVSLPGNRNDHYGYAGAVYVYGSGWIQKWVAPNGGRFAFLHLGILYTSTAGMPRVYPPSTTRASAGNPELARATLQDEGDEATARSVGSVSTIPQTVMAASYPGGAIVGRSRWPDDPAYGNGSAGAYNAHLCWLADKRASDWMYHVLTRKPVKPFPVRAWRRWFHAPYKRHGHLMRLPQYWAAHGKIAARCGSPVGKEGWWKRYRFMRQAFRRGIAYHWPRKRGDPVAFRC